MELRLTAKAHVESARAAPASVVPDRSIGFMQTNAETTVPRRALCNAFMRRQCVASIASIARGATPTARHGGDR